MDDLGKRLRARAQDLGLSDAEVGRRVGLDPARYGHYVSGRRNPDYSTLLRICSVLGMTPNDLLISADRRASSERTRQKDRLITAANALDDRDLGLAVVLVEALLRHAERSVKASRRKAPKPSSR